MTSERRFMLDFADVRGVVVECHQCAGRMTIPMKGGLRSDFLNDCAFCGAEWLHMDNRAEVLKSALRALMTLRKTMGNGALPVSIRLEFDELVGSGSPPAAS